jgi:predicted transcriptional regulator
MLFSIIVYYIKKVLRYRSKIDIISHILETANGGGATKTTIMHKAYISYLPLKEYLMVLTQSDLLHYDEEMQSFKTTEKGLRFLKTYNRINDIMKPEI